jgi:hypothetical protein
MARSRTILLAVTAAVALAATQLPPPAAAARMAAIPNDFNGDGYADLAIGAQGEDSGSRDNAGAVHVLYGSGTGLTAAGDEYWTQDTPGVKGRTHDGTDWSGDDFGAALASGDFDRDGYADLAIGVPGDRVGSTNVRGGAVNVLYGSSSGLTAAGDQRWSQANLPGTPEKHDWFGRALAAGDFDGDGYWDLAIGVPWEQPTGQVQLLYGGPNGLTSAGTAVLTRSSAGPPTPAAASPFGHALVAGDLNRDGRADLAVGAPVEETGEVAVFYGSSSGVTSFGSQRWSQASPGIDDAIVRGDRFGAALAVGDFDADGSGDLAVGVPNIALDAVVGKVIVLRGSIGGVVAAGRRVWPSPVGGTDDWGPEFGFALAAGDFDGDDTDDLAIGAPWEGSREGVVLALYGVRGAGLGDADRQLWSQESAGVPGTSEDDDVFGIGVTALDTNGDGRDELAIGVSGESTARDGVGRVVVIRGHAAGLSGGGVQGWTQDSPGIKDAAEAWDHFGSTLAGSPGRIGW